MSFRTVAAMTAALGMAVATLLTPAFAHGQPALGGDPFTVKGWLQQGYNGSHSGYNPNETSINATNVPGLTRKWTSGGGSSDPVVSGGIVVNTTRGNNKCLTVTAVNASTGKPVWHANIGAFQCTEPVIAGNNVYLVTNNPWYLYGWRLTSGKRFLVKKLGQARFAGLVALNSVGPLYLNSANGWVKELDPGNGKQIWAYNTGSTLNDVAPAIGNQGALYVTGPKGQIFAVGLAKGHLQWKKTVGGVSMILDANLGVADNRLFVSSDPDTLFAVDLTKKGAVVWNDASAGYNSDFAAAYHKIFITSPPMGPHGQGPSVFALNDATGKVLWSFTTGYVGVKPSVANGIVYVSNDGVGSQSMFFALNASTGTKLWSAAGVGPYLSFPAIWNGWVYVGNAAFSLK